MSNRHNCEEWCVKCWPMPEAAAPSEPVAWCPRDKNAHLYVEHSCAHPDLCADEVVTLNRIESEFAPYTVVPLYTRPAPAPREVTEADAQDVLREMVTAVRNGNAIAPILTAALAVSP